MAVVVTNNVTSTRILHFREKAVRSADGRHFDRMIMLLLVTRRPAMSKRFKRSTIPPHFEVWDLAELGEKLATVEDTAALQAALDALKTHTPDYDSAASNRPLVWNLPAPAAPLIGRQMDAGMAALLLQQHRCVAICGGKGKGKTALAAAVLADLGPPAGYQGPFPRRLLTHSFRHSPDHESALIHLATQAGLETHGLKLEELENLCRQVLSETSTYACLDDCECATELPRLLELAQGAHLLLTTSDPVLPEGVEGFDLETLTVVDAAKIIAAVSSDGHLQTGTPAHLDLARFLDAHPLCSKLAGHILGPTGWSATKLVANLKAANLEHLTGRQRESSAIFCLLGYLWSLAATAHPASGTVLSLLALGSLAPLPASRLAAAADQAREELEAALHVLKRQGLVELHHLTDGNGQTEDHWCLSHSQIKDFALSQESPAVAQMPQLYSRWRDGWLEFLEACWQSKKLPGDQVRAAVLQPHMQAVLAVLQEREPADSVAHPLALTYIAALNHRHGRIYSAELLYKKNFLWCRQHLGTHSPTTLNGANNLAVLLHSQGQLAKAEQLYRYVLVEQERTLGPGHPHTLASLNNLATVRSDQGSLEEAEALYRRVLEAQERTQGPAHADTITCLGNLASVLSRNEQYVQAERLYRRVIMLKEQTLGVDHPETLQSMHALAMLLKRSGDLAGAETLLRQVQRDRQRLLGADHPKTLATLNYLGVLVEAQGDMPQAEALYQEAATNARHRMPPHDPRRQGFERNLARVRRLLLNTPGGAANLTFPSEQYWVD